MSKILPTEFWTSEAVPRAASLLSRISRVTTCESSQVRRQSLMVISSVNVSTGRGTISRDKKLSVVSCQSSVRKWGVAQEWWVDWHCGRDD